MSWRLALVTISTVLFGGCMMDQHCGGNGMCGGDTDRSGGCRSNDECPSGAHCSPSSSCVAGNDAPGGCTTDAQCGPGEYCAGGEGACRQATPCTGESDCAPGFNCDPAKSACFPASAPTCGELGTEAECAARADCLPIYAGIECSCGADCTCQGGEPGCVCQSFEFFRCADL